MGRDQTVEVMEPFIEQLKEQLHAELPGMEAQIKMAPYPRYVPPQGRSEEEAIPAAVLVVLFPRHDSWFFILTERSSEVEHHQGQISLPGGAHEGDESLRETALREAEEELGIDVGSVSMLGELTPLFIPVSGFRVHPFVAVTKEEPYLRPDPTEVGSVHFASVDQLVDEDCIQREVRQIRGLQMEVPYFRFDHLKVWGATAAMLSEFREVVQRTMNNLSVQKEPGKEVSP
ncbi:MAG: CoA pyrophosphatase [Candidatus Marinimicrobia bacterium]|nr:CoA pyrophosphatase [Candidatus Neomarinimicrobiota bacterium]MDP6594257.1 CoA pyrophosphatase [Candidatus Neomarinimicrobiota bacterium]MDP6965787.1 CoA pyrophosphatase [Candidatus Neomarinimicrobiota bacterium]